MSAARPAGGPLGPVASTALRPVSWAWRAVAALRNARFDAGHGVQRVAVPVVSVGNIAVGGTGKTPFVAWCVTALREAGHRPAIAMRGYGSKRGERSDEEREYEIVVPGVPVLVGGDRVAAINEHLARHADAVDVIVLDDGFQHRRLARDVDLVLVDAARPALDSPLLPSGWLREPAEGLHRATGVVVTRADAVDDALAREIERVHGRPPLAWCRHAWRGLLLHERGTERRVESSWVRGRRAFALFGVGHPEAVADAYRRAGAEIVGRAPLRDHQRFTPEAVTVWLAQAVASGAECIATTRKDWTKLRDCVPRDAPPIVVPDVAIEFVDGAESLRRMLLDSFRAPRAA